MIIVDPVTLGDVACTRASPGTYFDRNGVLQTAPANTLRVTYDPADLSKAPYALVEAAATNYIAASEDFTSYWAGYYGKPALTKGYPAPDGSNNATRLASSDAGPSDYPGISGLIIYNNTGATLAGRFAVSIWARCVSGTLAVSFGFTDGYMTNYTLTTSWQRLVFDTGGVAASVSALPGGRIMQIFENNVGNQEWEVWGAQVELNVSGMATSYIASTNAAAGTTRAVDVVAAGAGLVYSNVAIAEPAYNAGATYVKDALVYDPATHNVFQSIIDANKGRALTDTGAWTPRGATNRWAMLDQYNNTQTTNADEIILVVSPQAISQGLYLGNMFVDEVRISVVDQVEGLVYTEAANLVESNSGGSFFNWCFKRIRRRDYFGTVKMPVYANALITICLRKIGGTAKCGMCAVGPVDEFGPTLMGLSTEGKDYSSTTFNFDGTSSTVIRPYAKRMTCDVMLDNDQIDYVQARLFDVRQKLIIWFGGPYGSTVVAGRYGSFKNVIQYPMQSLMNLTIEGAV